jgi:hydroxypyruvate isomerase
MPLRFSANVSMLWAELPLLERFAAAARAGFEAVELWWPGEDAEQVPAAVRDAGVEVVLLNFDGGDLAAGERGLLNHPAREGRFHRQLPVALDLARELGCRQLHALVGVEAPEIPRDEQLSLARANVGRAARAAAPQGATIVVEALNALDVPGYLLASTDAAAAFAGSVGEPNVAVQFDAYHAAQSGEDPLASFLRHASQIAHVQFADSPGRGEPGTGRSDVASFLGALERAGWVGWVGAEYRPTTARTEDSLGWFSATA